MSSTPIIVRMGPKLQQFLYLHLDTIVATSSCQNLLANTIQGKTVEPVHRISGPGRKTCLPLKTTVAKFFTRIFLFYRQMKFILLYYMYIYFFCFSSMIHGISSLSF